MNPKNQHDRLATFALELATCPACRRNDECDCNIPSYRDIRTLRDAARWALWGKRQPTTKRMATNDK